MLSARWTLGIGLQQSTRADQRRSIGMGEMGVGERVVSGVYFYTLTAGDFSITRRMVILK